MRAGPAFPYVLSLLASILLQTGSATGSPRDRAAPHVSPFAVELTGVFGIGRGRSQDMRPFGFADLEAIDVHMRDRSNRTWLLSHASGDLVAVPVESTQRLHHAALMVGRAWTAPGSGVRGYTKLMAGIGRVSPRVDRQRFDADGSPTPAVPISVRYGPAIGASAGLRLIPAPGPVGLVLLLRTGGMYTSSAWSGFCAVSFGLTVFPR